MTMAWLLTWLLWTLAPVFACAQEDSARGPWFHHGGERGGDASYNPLTVFLNGSFDIGQIGRYSRDIAHYPFASAAHNVFGSLGHPIAAIETYGWGPFLRTEVLPLTFTTGASWWPNYQLHLIGGGYTYARLAEWYEAHGAPVPRILSFVTVMGYHFVNEVMENNNVPGLLIDPVADIYLFDLGGILLFSSPAVCRFFSETVVLADWSLQPTMMLGDGKLRNAGQYFAARWKLPFSTRLSLFYYFGLSGLLGASYDLGAGYGLSAGAGLRSRDLRAAVAHPLQVNADLVWNAGVFLDQRNSLLVSVVASGVTTNMLLVNVYPGVLPPAAWSPGFWFSLTPDLRPAAGVTTRWTPGVGY
jgi:hypothetical protein